MIIFAVVASAVLAWRERTTFRRGAMERSLAVVTAVDAEVKSSIGTLEALAASRHLDTGDLRSFHAEAARARASQRDWLTIILALPSSEQVVNVLLPFGTPLPPTLERASFDELLRRSVPAVGHLARGPVTEHGTTTLVWAFPVRVPVVRDGTTKYVLSAVVKPDRMRALLAAQRLPPDWVGVLIDANARIVARTVAPEQSIGELASDSLRTALAQSSEGWFHGTTLEGADVYTPYHRSAVSGWRQELPTPSSGE